MHRVQVSIEQASADKITGESAGSSANPPAVISTASPLPKSGPEVPRQAVCNQLCSIEESDAVDADTDLQLALARSYADYSGACTAAASGAASSSSSICRPTDVAADRVCHDNVTSRHLSSRLKVRGNSTSDNCQCNTEDKEDSDSLSVSTQEARRPKPTFIGPYIPWRKRYIVVGKHSLSTLCRALLTRKRENVLIDMLDDISGGSLKAVSTECLGVVRRAFCGECYLSDGDDDSDNDSDSCTAYMSALRYRSSAVVGLHPLRVKSKEDSGSPTRPQTTSLYTGALPDDGWMCGSPYYEQMLRVWGDLPVRHL